MCACVMPGRGRSGCSFRTLARSQPPAPSRQKKRSRPPAAPKPPTHADLRRRGWTEEELFAYHLAHGGAEESGLSEVELRSVRQRLLGCLVELGVAPEVVSERLNAALPLTLPGREDVPPNRQAAAESAPKRARRSKDAPAPKDAAAPAVCGHPSAPPPPGRGGGVPCWLDSSFGLRRSQGEAAPAAAPAVATTEATAVEAPVTTDADPAPVAEPAPTTEAAPATDEVVPVAAAPPTVA